MAELTNERFVQLQRVADQYAGMSGGYDAADLVAAGFSPEEVAEFDVITRQLSTPYTGDMPEETFASAREPTRRERNASTLAEFFGGETADRDDYRRALKFTGTTDPSATFADQMGLADLTPLSALYGIEEGTDTFQRGVRTRDPVTAGLGFAEAVLSAAESAPAVGFAVKGAGKVVDNLLDAGRRTQADEFFARADAASEGNTGASMSGRRVYIPSEDELDIMRANPTPEEQIYLNSIDRSRAMASAGASTDDILETTGILRLPIAGQMGQPLGVREVFASGDDFQGLRNPDKPNPVYVPQSDLGPGTAGDFNAGTGTIRISDELDLVDAMQTAEHETSHFDHMRGLNLAAQREIGSNPQYEAELLMDKVQNLRAIAADTSVPDDVRESARSVLDEVLRNESGLVNYRNNPGEILARAASGELETSVLATPSELFNPYINPQPSGNIARGLDALRMKIRPDLRPPGSLLALDRRPPRSITVPMDVRRGQVNDRLYVFEQKP